MVHSDVARRSKQHGSQAPEVGGERAEAQQGVHADGVVFGISDGGAVEYPARVEHHNGGENQTQPLPARELSGRHHRDNHDGQGENRCDDEAGDEIAASFLLRLYDLLVRIDGGDAIAVREKPGVVAGPLHRLDEILGTVAVGCFQGGAFGGEVDHALHPLKFVEGALHMVGTISTGQAQQCEFNMAIVRGGRRHMCGGRRAVCTAEAAGAGQLSSAEDERGVEEGMGDSL